LLIIVGVLVVALLFVAFWVLVKPHMGQSAAPAPATTSSNTATSGLGYPGGGTITADPTIPPITIPSITIPSINIPPVTVPGTSTGNPYPVPTGDLPTAGGGNGGDLCFDYAMAQLNSPGMMHLFIMMSADAPSISTTIEDSIEVYQDVINDGAPSNLAQPTQAMITMMENWKAKSDAGDAAGAQAAYTSDESNYTDQFNAFTAAGDPLCPS
jgi:hypothetical protein